MRPVVAWLVAVVLGGWGSLIGTERPFACDKIQPDLVATMLGWKDFLIYSKR